ncbi:hypothetical protein Fmac_025054 [Flemingia macrophylla]|uniref:Uncharacterized protein n=1 Tax=Flemingia macrophylla TaxID=520843 RepID=A0ABD1LR41_9FABA
MKELKEVRLWLLITNMSSCTKSIATTNVLVDAAKHIKGRDANEHAIHVATDATASPLAPMAIRNFVHVMHASRLMGINLNALEIIGTTRPLLKSILFEFYN